MQAFFSSLGSFQNFHLSPRPFHMGAPHFCIMLRNQLTIVFFFSVHLDTIQKPLGGLLARHVLLEAVVLSGIAHQCSVYLAR